MNKEALLEQISDNFNLTSDEAEVALLLLDTRAANLDLSLDEYMQAYHPLGFSQKDSGLSPEYKGYVRFLADDAKAIIKTGKTADFSTFVHEQAHIFRRQLAGDLKAKAEKAFKVENGKWSQKQEEYFAIGFEEYIRLRMASSEDLRQVFERGARCMQHIYNGLDRIVELNPEIIKVYDELFTDSRFHFKQDEFEKTIKDIKDNSLQKFKASHVYLGMTPPIYQEIGFERLPVMITARHLKTVMQDWGSYANVNYHGLTSDIIAQIPEAIKKPLVIMQSQNKKHPEDIIAVVELKDKDNKPIIIPFSPNKKGYINDIEIDINLAKSIYGKDNFDRFIQRAAQENRILFINSKSRDIVPPQVQYPRNYKSQLSDKSRVLAIPRVQYPSNQGSQLLYDNIARYQAIVKQNIPNFAKLYQAAAAPEEIETVRQKYIDTADYLKAPNGADTNLTERQWLQVRTDSFKKWFGDWENDTENASKVLDENGEPLVVYHGSRTGGNFNTFNDVNFFSSDFSTADMFKSEADYGIYVNDERFGDVSRSIAYDIAYGINDGYDLEEQVNTTYDLEEVQDYDAIQEAIEYFTGQSIPENGTISIKENAPVFECFLNFRNPKIIDYEGKAWGTGKNDVYVEADLNGLEEAGYDGLIGKNIIEGGAADLRNGDVPPVSTDYVTLKANQIKSATENIGSFDMTNNNILFQRSSYYSRETQKEKRAENINKIAGYFIKAIETNTAPWMKPWKANEYVDDFNPVTKTTYKGINSVILPFIRETEFHSNDPRWYTFNNAKEQNFMVKKGEKATPIVFYGTVPIGKDGKALAVDEEGKPIGDVVRFRLTLRFYKVFHASQLGVPQFDKDGNLLRDETGAVISTPIEAFEQPKIETIDFKPIASAEKLLQQSGARIYHDQTEKSFYNTETDSIHLCPKEQYINESLYYGTALHELTHWTGSSQRLDRSLDTYGLDIESRAREELIAEIGSYALCKDLKLDFNPQNNVAYVQSWCEILRDKPEEIVKATHAALEAKEYIQGFEHTREKTNERENINTGIVPDNFHGGNKMEQGTNAKKENLLFYEESTGKILYVRATDEEYVFKWTVYNTKNNEIVNTFLDDKVNTLFDNSNTTEMNKAVDTAMSLSGINKFDVYILDDTFEEKIKEYEKHPVMDTKFYSIFENESLKIVNNRDNHRIQMFFSAVPNEKIMHDLEFYEWEKAKHRLCWERPNSMISIDCAGQLKDKWYEKGYFDRQTESEKKKEATNDKKSVREVGKEIWSLTNFSEGNTYGTDFETWYKECFPYYIHKATDKILDGHSSYKGGSFVEMEAWEAKDSKPHTFFFDKEHFVEYYDERQKKQAELQSAPRFFQGEAPTQKQTEFAFSGKEMPCYNPTNGKLYKTQEFEDHLKAINSDDKRYLSQKEIIKLGFSIKSNARPILLKTEKEIAGKIQFNYELLYNGKDITGLPPAIGKEKEKVSVRQPVRSIGARSEKEYGMEIG